MNESRFLKPMNHKIKNINIYGFDIETYGSSNKFLMGSIVNETEQHIFWNQDKLKDFLINSPKMSKAWLFATNLGFDFLGTFGGSFKDLSNFKYLIRGSDFINIKYINPNKKGTVEFLDTMNFLKVGVKGLGKIIGYEKMTAPKNLGKKIKRISKEGQYLEKYNIRDSYISFKFADFLNKSFNSIGATMGYTIASTSMSLFRNKYLKDWILQPSKENIKFLNNGFYGGRTEAFIRGKINNLNLNLYDINSLYPYVMQKYKYPNPNTLFFVEDSDLSYLKFEGVSLCKIETPKDLNIPLLPHRYDNKLLFPLGKFKGYHSHVELRKAIQLRYKIKVIKSICYENTFNPFKKFVNNLYTYRMKYKKQKNKMEIVFKILLNSLYGKFNQKMYNTEIIFSYTPKQKLEMQKYIDVNIFNETNGLPLRFNINTPDRNISIENGIKIENPRIYYVTDYNNNSYSKFINPILSLYTTSYARLELYKLFEEIENNNGSVYYCDTDSVITDYKFKCGNKLGELKNELSVNKGLIVKPKMYYLEEKESKIYTKSKGLRNLKNKKAFFEVIKHKKYDYMKFTKFKESLRRNLDFNSILFVEKNINLNDDKREWNYSNFNKNRKEKSKPKILNQIF